jgi:hypothetical protein
MLPSCAALDSSSFAVACVTAIVLVTGSASLAQVAGGTISGSVRDRSEGARDPELGRRDVAAASSAIRTFRHCRLSWHLYGRRINLRSGQREYPF